MAGAYEARVRTSIGRWVKVLEGFALKKRVLEKYRR
jgi:hypothetical protein